MKQLIKDFAVEIYATSQEDLDIDAISAKVTKAMGANYSGDNGMLRSKGSRSAARGKSSSKSAPEAPPAPKSVSPKAAAPPVPAPPAAAEVSLPPHPHFLSHLGLIFTRTGSLH